jgi:hypothetical protein
MRDIANRELGRRNQRFLRNPGQAPTGIAQHPAYRQDLADFRRLLGDVAVESLTADHVRNYLARVPNRSIASGA